MAPITVIVSDFFNGQNNEQFTTTVDIDVASFTIELLNTNSMFQGILICKGILMPIANTIYLDHQVVFSLILNQARVLVLIDQIPVAAINNCNLIIIQSFDITEDSDIWPSTVRHLGPTIQTLIDQIQFNSHDYFPSINTTITQASLNPTDPIGRLVSNRNSTTNQQPRRHRQQRSTDSTTNNPTNSGSSFQPISNVTVTRVTFSDTDLENIRIEGENRLIRTMTSDSDVDMFGPGLARMFDAVNYYTTVVNPASTFDNVKNNLLSYLNNYRIEGQNTFPYTSNDHRNFTFTFERTPDNLTMEQFWFPIIRTHQWQDIQRFRNGQGHHCIIFTRCPLNEFSVMKNSATNAPISPTSLARSYFRNLSQDNLRSMLPENNLISRFTLIGLINDITCIYFIQRSTQMPVERSVISAVPTQVNTTHGVSNSALLARQQERNRVIQLAINNLNLQDYTYYSSTGANAPNPNDQRYRNIARNLLNFCNLHLGPHHQYSLTDFGL